MQEKILTLYSTQQPPVDGEDFVLRPRVVCIIKHISENSYLLVEDEHGVSFPGGGIDGENLDIAAFREASEETGYINFLSCTNTHIILNYYRREKDHNRLSKTFLVILKLKDLIYQKGEWETMRVAKEKVTEMLSTDASKILRREVQERLD